MATAGVCGLSCSLFTPSAKTNCCHAAASAVFPTAAQSYARAWFCIHFVMSGFLNFPHIRTTVGRRPMGLVPPPSLGMRKYQM